MSEGDGHRHTADDLRDALEDRSPEGDHATVLRLAGLSAIEYDRIRQAEAKRLGVHVKALDADVARARRELNGNRDGGGEAVLFQDIKPAPDPVDGTALLDRLAATLRHYAVLPEHADVAIALWVLLTYTLEAASICAILVLTSPEKRCGKTTILSLLLRLSHRALSAANITAAALFRAVGKWQPTLLIDEADTFLRHSEELRGVINSGHTRDTAYVIRTVGDDHEPRQFRTWAPKVIALIGNTPDTIQDRSIVIPLRRKLSSESVERLRRDDRFTDLVAQCLRWAQDNMEGLQSKEPETVSALNDRAADNWSPLLAIAHAAGGDWPERAHKAAIALSGGDQAEDPSVKVKLLADIRDTLDQRGIDKIESAVLVDCLVEMDDRPWPEWHNGKAITRNGLARLLKPFGIKTKQVWIGGRNHRGYERSQFDDAFARYLPAQSARPLEPRPGAGFSRFQNARDGNGLALSNRPETHAT